MSDQQSAANMARPRATPDTHPSLFVGLAAAMMVLVAIAFVVWT